MSVRSSPAVGIFPKDDRLNKVLAAGMRRLSLQCAPCDRPYAQPPDYTLPSMQIPNGRTPVELGEEMINICGICYSPLEGHPEEDETLPDDLERVESTQFQYHRWCLAKWAWTHDNDPGSPTSPLQPLEIEGLLNFRPREFEVGDLVYFTAGMRGHEHVVRIYNKLDGIVYRYKGEQGEERRVLAELPNGTVQLYEGPRDEERVV